MKKIFKLKEWMTVPAAAKHLSQILEDEINASDVLQLALDGHIKLSVNFPNGAKARLGKITPYKEVPVLELPPIGEGAATHYLNGYPLEQYRSTDEINEETPFICFDKEVVSIEGTWDMAMMGNERIDVEFALYQMIDGPEVTMVNIDGTFLNRPDGTWASLQDKFDDKVVKDHDGKEKILKGGYFPSGGIGDDCLMVVRTSELVGLQDRMNGKSEEKPIGSRERSTYLNIIGVLLEKYVKKDEPLINEIQQEYPAVPGLKPRTLQEKFAEARRTLKAN